MLAAVSQGRAYEGLWIPVAPGEAVSSVTRRARYQ